MVFYVNQQHVKAAHDSGLKYSVLLLFFVGSKAYRERIAFVQDFHHHHEATSPLEEATMRETTVIDDELPPKNMEAKAVEFGSHPHTQLGMALDAWNHKMGVLFPWNGDDMARALFATGLLIVLSCILGSIWLICRPSRSEKKHVAGMSNKYKSEPNDSQQTEDESRKYELEGCAAEFEALSHRLPAEVQKVPKHWTTSLFKGLLDRYIAIIPKSSSEQSSEALRWRHAHLTWWGSKNEYNDGLPPKGSMPILQIAEIRIIHEIPSIWMSTGSKAVVLSDKKDQENELTLILEKKSAELFYATLRQYLDKLEKIG